jgi:hypothetical protein
MRFNGTQLLNGEQTSSRGGVALNSEIPDTMFHGMQRLQGKSAFKVTVA